MFVFFQHKLCVNTVVDNKIWMTFEVGLKENKSAEDNADCSVSFNSWKCNLISDLPCDTRVLTTDPTITSLTT